MLWAWWTSTSATMAMGHHAAVSGELENKAMSTRWKRTRRLEGRALSRSARGEARHPGGGVGGGGGVRHPIPTEVSGEGEGRGAPSRRTSSHAGCRGRRQRTSLDTAAVAATRRPRILCRSRGLGGRPWPGKTVTYTAASAKTPSFPSNDNDDMRGQIKAMSLGDLAMRSSKRRSARESEERERGGAAIHLEGRRSTHWRWEMWPASVLVA